MDKVIFRSKGYGNTVFEIDRGCVSMSMLFGMAMYPGTAGGPARIQGILDYDCVKEGKCAETARLEGWENEDDTLTLTYRMPKSGVVFRTAWTADRELGILTREDEITNMGASEVCLHRYLPKFVFAPGNYECYVQNSTWCYEDRGGWEPLGRAGVFLQCEGGRTTQGAAPVLGLRSRTDCRGLAFHIIPKGNWEIRLQRASGGVGPQGMEMPLLRLGQSSDGLACRIEPGKSLKLPKLLIQGLPQGNIYGQTESLQKWLRKNASQPNRAPHKVVYNPWYSCYDHINVEDFLRWARIAKQIGCEIFEVDAGWYGQGDDWGCCVGDWREKQDGAFRGKMKEFSDQIRAMGMGFGLWMEPERTAGGAPVYQAHPQWFARGSGDCYFPKLWEKEPYEYIKGEMLRLIETYELAWMKLDFNFELEEDETGSQFLYYYENLYRMIDEIKEIHPEVFIEACASGGLRTDINTMMHFDGHFICDNVSPLDGQNMYEQLLARTFSDKIYQWLAVMKGATVPAYFRDTSDVEQTVIVPSAPGAGFGDYERLDLDFLCKLIVRGMFGITGDIATLDEKNLMVLQKYIEFYKSFRPLLADSTVVMDSEPSCIGERDKWSVLEYYSETMDEMLIYVYRFGDIATRKQVYPKHVREDGIYLVKRKDGTQEMSGEELMFTGIEAKLPSRNSGEIIYLCPKEGRQ